MTYHLAIDIGASSGRHILGWVEGGRMHLKEVYRFENRLVEKTGHLCWEMGRLGHRLSASTRGSRRISTSAKVLGLSK